MATKRRGSESYRPGCGSPLTPESPGNIRQAAYLCASIFSTVRLESKNTDSLGG